jgi:hypothetical protein
MTGNQKEWEKYIALTNKMTYNKQIGDQEDFLIRWYSFRITPWI